MPEGSRPGKGARAYNRRLSTQPSVDVPAGPRLESWKEIAAYLNRSERTVRRWEDREGLPVHRLQHDKRGSVYAYAAELDAWRVSRRQLVDAEPAAPPARPLVSAVTGRKLWLSAIVILTIAVAAAVWWVRRPPDSAAGPDPEAVRLAARAFFAGNAGRVQIQTGIRYLQEAIRRDPSYAAAWSGLATAHVAETFFGDRPVSETMTAAKREAEEALRLDPNDSGAWRSLGWVAHLEWDHQTAETRFRKAIELAPASGVAHSWYADFLVDMRRFDEARTSYSRAQDVSPRWLEPITFGAYTYTLTGNPDLAIVQQQRVLESEPNFGLGIHSLGRSYLVKGDYSTAVTHLRKSNELLGEVPFSRADLGYALARAGRRADAEAMLAELTAKRAHGYYPAFAIAVIHLGLGDVDAALEWLERAVDDRLLGFYMPSADPIYDPLRSHPRFQALLQRINRPH